MLSSVEILILAAIQGVFEFLPVSSAAHLILISKFYDFTNQSLLIDICLHLGSLLAIIFYFRIDLFNFAKNRNFLIKILIGTIPIIPAGYILFETGLIDQFRSLKITIENYALGSEKKNLVIKQLKESSSSTINKINENSNYFKKKSFFLTGLKNP